MKRAQRYGLSRRNLLRGLGAAAAVAPWLPILNADGQEALFGLWSGATLNEPSGDANFDGGNGLRTGWGSGPSVDRYLAEQSGSELPYQLAADAPVPETSHRTLTLGVQCMDPHSMHRMIYKGNNSPVHPQTDPQAAFDSLFAGLTAAPAAGEAPVAADPVRLAQLDLLAREV